MNRYMRTATVVLLASVAGGVATAADLSGTLDAKSLTITAACFDAVEVVPDSSLAGRIVYQASATTDAELGRLIAKRGPAASLTIKAVPDCRVTARGSGDNQTTLALSVRVPPAMALALDIVGAGKVGVGELSGPLKARVAGSSVVSVAAAGAVDVNLSGSGRMIVNAANGDVATALSGSGGILVKSGTVGKLTATVSGSGAIHVETTVREADLRVSGAGTIALANASGPVRQKTSGSGTISIGQ
jgi:hypothetical protein